MSQREASNGLVKYRRRRVRKHLSPYQKFQRRAINQIKEKEHWVEQITETLAPKVDKQDVHHLSIVEKITLGKDIIKVMHKEKDKLTYESQVLKDRMNIQEAVDAEKGYHKKMAKMRQLLKECPTS